jgi:aminoglycoside 6'-N-acetyltransferase I
MITIRRLAAGDDAVLAASALDVFDGAPDPELIREFLQDPRHHIVVAIDDDQVTGFATAVHYVHPDKKPELWINEVGVAPTH